MMPKTGETCHQSGLYRGDDEHHEEIALSSGETFPPCRSCQRAVNWTLIQATRN